jgi:hypothetical protein
MLSLIAAPAVLTNAASVLALSTSNRFLRASERMRSLSVRLESEVKSLDAARLLLVQVSRVEKQAVLLLSALKAIYVALGSFAGASLISIVGAGLASSPFQLAFQSAVVLALAVGFAGAGGLIWGCLNLFRATRISMLNISDEAALIRERERGRQSPPSESRI